MSSWILMYYLNWLKAKQPLRHIRFSDCLQPVFGKWIFFVNKLLQISYSKCWCKIIMFPAFKKWMQGKNSILCHQSTYAVYTNHKSLEKYAGFIAKDRLNTKFCGDILTVLCTQVGTWRGQMCRGVVLVRHGCPYNMLVVINRITTNQ